MGYFHDMTRWAADHPGTTIAIAAGGTLVAVPMAVATPVLGLAGFGGQGIAAGSVAAGVQSGIGNVAAGSTFATLQSAAMGGYGAAAVGSITQGAGVAIAVCAAPYKAIKEYFGKKSSDAPGDSTEEDNKVSSEESEITRDTEGNRSRNIKP